MNTIEKLAEIEAALKEALDFNQDSDAGLDVENSLNDALSLLSQVREDAEALLNPEPVSAAQEQG